MKSRPAAGSARYRIPTKPTELCREILFSKQFLEILNETQDNNDRRTGHTGEKDDLEKAH